MDARGGHIFVNKILLTYCFLAYFLLLTVLNKISLKQIKLNCMTKSHDDEKAMKHIHSIDSISIPFYLVTSTHTHQIRSQAKFYWITNFCILINSLVENFIRFPRLKTFLSPYFWVKNYFPFVSRNYFSLSKQVRIPSGISMVKCKFVCERE
jgi:hypothetical protein